MCKEKEVKMIELELDFDEKTVEGLLSYARENIINDEAALINWAANVILKKIVDTDGECLKEKDNKDD